MAVPEIVFGAATLSADVYNTGDWLESDQPLRTLRLALRHAQVTLWTETSLIRFSLVDMVFDSSIPHRITANPNQSSALYSND
ncbi:hypothetical protein FRC14_000465 [Serendipita sp. 396]|nr:hypothetical protein FRC14_000465 [Serendipita sp. 396]